MRVEVGADGILHLLLDEPVPAPGMAIDPAALSAARDQVTTTLSDLGVTNHAPPMASYRQDGAGALELWRFSVMVPGTQGLRAPKGPWGGRPRRRRRP